MSPYISDRQRVEAALPATFMWSVVENGADQDEDAEACSKLLLRCMWDAVQDMGSFQAQQKVLRRAERAYHQVADPWAGEGLPVGKFGLIVYYWLRSMIDAGFISIPDGSPFEAAMEMVLPALEPHANIEGVDRSAQKQAPKFHARLQALGYYRGADINGEN